MGLHDEYDVEFWAKGTKDQLNALVVAASHEGFWPVIKRHMRRQKYDDQWMLRYVALNEKYWDIQFEMSAGSKLVGLATRMGLEAKYTTRRCW